MDRSTRRGGFTLIELLVVVAIIALLISILLPSLGQSREQAKMVVCRTRLRELYQGHALYAAEWAGRFPEFDRWLYKGRETNVPSRDWVEHGQIFRYLLSKEVYFCPKDDKRRLAGGDAIGSGGVNGDQPIHSYVRALDVHYYSRYNLRPDWPEADGSPKLVHYVSPDWLRSGLFTPPLYNNQNEGRNYHQFRVGTPIPGRILLMFEEHPGFGLNGWWQLNDGYSSKVIFPVDYLATRHKNNGHLLFWDGHTFLANSERFNLYPADSYAMDITLGGDVKP